VFGSIFKRALTLYNTQQCRRSKGVYVIKFSDALSLLNNNNKKAGAWRASPLCCLRYHVLQVRGKKKKKFFFGRSHGLYFFFLSAGILFYSVKFSNAFLHKCIHTTSRFSRKVCKKLCVVHIISMRLGVEGIIT